MLIRWGKHAGLGEQLAVIEDKAFALREMAIRDRYGEPPWRSVSAALPGP